jgi:DNA transformation protein and related proteins
LCNAEAIMVKRTLPPQITALFVNFDDFRSRAMFGGFGLYLQDVFFAVVAGGRLYLKVSDETRPDYEALGSGPFEPWDGHVMAGYYEVPESVRTDKVTFREWVMRAVENGSKKRR